VDVAARLQHREGRGEPAYAAAYDCYAHLCGVTTDDW
jgi:hypothetical protein